MHGLIALICERAFFFPSAVFITSGHGFPVFVVEFDFARRFQALRFMHAQAVESISQVWIRYLGLFFFGGGEGPTISIGHYYY